jgi:ribosomal protein S18 acetylase RimI-like enzyme
LSGFVCVEYREWIRLGQVQGLAVDPVLKRRGIASELLHRAEEFVQAEGGRGIYEALGYRQAYVMPEYYEEGLDGVTCLKRFPNILGR